MMDTFLRQRLRRIFQREQLRGLGWELAVSWATGALAGVAAIWIARSSGYDSTLTMPAIAALSAATAAWAVVRRLVVRPDYRALATRVEKAHPELNGLILTAVQQQADASGGAQSYFQQRLLEQAIERSRERDWRRLIPGWQVVLSLAAQFAALAFLAAVLVKVYHVAPLTPTEAGELAVELSVTPGDTLVERGETLVVLARFGRDVPSGAALAITESGKPVRNVPLVKSLADPVFGGTLPGVSSDFAYRVEYAGQRSRDFQVKVFEFPRLERADAELTYPTYTKQEPKRVEDTRRLSAVEGTSLGLTLQLNKAVTSAKLVARDKAKTTLTLATSPEKAVATLAPLLLASTQTYDLQLVDSEGRINKLPTPFVIEVQPNRRPELRLVSPRGDVRPSSIEEIAFEGTVWDDFGSSVYGLAYSEAGGDVRTLELGRDALPRDRKTFSHLLSLEQMKVKPDSLLSWYLWADDIGPDGKVRRTTTDLYFGEVRPFDEIFREETGMQGESEQGEQQGQGGSAQKLTELQKQIMSATWKIQRDPTRTTYQADVQVVRDSQMQALEQAREAAEKSERPRDRPLWTEVTQAMERAASQLNDATASPKPLPAALASEQTAYQALLKLQQHETNVRRGRNRSGGQGGQQGNQQQMDQLDLAQSENRYETQRQAKAAQDPQRRDQLQTINRLQELAHRQEAVNERLKELQTALQEARTDEKREEIRRELKRLQEEQREMLADLDELRQRMDKPENQSRMADERKQLDETRRDLQRAADAAADGSVPQALAAGTRAQRQLQDMRDTLRKENSSEFSEELRDLRGEARELARQQRAIGEKLGALADGKKKSLTDEPVRNELSEELAAQRERMKDVLKRTTELSEQAETTEPLVSRQLYESLRKVSQDDANASKQLQQDLLAEGMMTRSLYERLKADPTQEGTKAFDLTAELLREGYLPQALTAEKKARAGIDELRKGVERAVGNVLGDDAEALKLAQSQLDEVTEQLAREAQQAGEGQPGEQPRGKGSANDRAKQLASAEAGRKEKGQGKGKGKGKGEGEGEGQGDGSGKPGESSGGERQVADARTPGGRSPGRGQGPGSAGVDLSTFMETEFGADPRAERAGNEGGPIMGGDFGPWAERLREVEEVLDRPDLRDAVATARERARAMRQEYRHDRKKPDWAVVRAEILSPLLEVRSRIGEELARRNANDPLAPVDRDPVPPRFAESVQKYYEELGKSP